MALFGTLNWVSSTLVYASVIMVLFGLIAYKLFIDPIRGYEAAVLIIPSPWPWPCRLML
jgi:hypothetical protein